VFLRRKLFTYIFIHLTPLEPVYGRLLEMKKFEERKEKRASVALFWKTPYIIYCQIVVIKFHMHMQIHAATKTMIDSVNEAAIFTLQLMNMLS